MEGDDPESRSLRNVPLAPKSASDFSEAGLAGQGTFLRPPNSFLRPHNLSCLWCITPHLTADRIFQLTCTSYPSYDSMLHTQRAGTNQARTGFCL
jgi:hypothetical protein